MTDRPRHRDGTPVEPLPAWGSGGGFLELKPVAPLGVEAAADRLAIVEAGHRYAWCYDERQLELLGDCFTEDAIWEGNVMGTIPIGPFEGRPQIMQWLQDFWPHQRDQRRHMIVNEVVTEQSADEATVLAYILLTAARRAAVKVETHGYYRFKIRREGDVWRIAHLFAGFDAPFWPGKVEDLGERGRKRHGVREEAAE